MSDPNGMGDLLGVLQLFSLVTLGDLIFVFRFYLVCAFFCIFWGCLIDHITYNLSTKVRATSLTFSRNFGFCSNNTSVRRAVIFTSVEFNTEVQCVSLMLY